MARLPLEHTNRPHGSPDLRLVLPPTGFSEVDIGSEFRSRLPRPRSQFHERHAYAALAAQLSVSPADVCRRVVDLAVDLCGAHTAGITVHDGDDFRWAATTGALGQCRRPFSVGTPNPFIA